MRFLRTALIIASLALCISAQAESTKAVSAKLKRIGYKTVRCPNYIAHMKSGLASTTVSNAMVCVNRDAKVKVKKGSTIDKMYKKTSHALDGSGLLGVGFAPIIGQEGDVQTVPFRVQNYPALVSYSVDNLTTNTMFQIFIVDAVTGQNMHEFYRVLGGRGNDVDEITLNKPGYYYLKLKGRPDGREQQQPRFDVSIRFMDPYLGMTLSKQDLGYAEIKVKRCPSYMVDSRNNALLPLSKFTCTDKEGLDYAGFTGAPLNVGQNLFLATDVYKSGKGGNFSLPFRVLGPTIMNYSVTDWAYEDSKGAGTTRMYLVDVTTGKREELVQVRGSIASSDTSINIPGDYYIEVETSPVDWKNYGDNEWSLSVMGSVM